MIKIDDLDTKAQSGLAAMRMNVRNAVRNLWTGNGDIFDFYEQMDAAIRLGYETAWREGAETCGIKPGERTIEETQRLEALIAENRQYIFGFGEAIEASSKANGGKLAPAMTRGELWINRYGLVKATAQTMACADVKLEWVWDPTIEQHCSDCRRLNGRVYRASIWEKYNLRPKMYELECHGYRCGCSFVPTDKPVTPGRPPQIGH